MCPIAGSRKHHVFLSIVSESSDEKSLQPFDEKSLQPLKATTERAWLSRLRCRAIIGISGGLLDWNARGRRGAGWLEEFDDHGRLPIKRAHHARDFLSGSIKDQRC